MISRLAVVVASLLLSCSLARPAPVLSPAPLRAQTPNPVRSFSVKHYDNIALNRYSALYYAFDFENMSLGSQSTVVAVNKPNDQVGDDWKGALARRIADVYSVIPADGYYFASIQGREYIDGLSREYAYFTFLTKEIGNEVGSQYTYLLTDSFTGHDYVIQSINPLRQSFTHFGDGDYRPALSTTLVNDWLIHTDVAVGTNEWLTFSEAESYYAERNYGDAYGDGFEDGQDDGYQAGLNAQQATEENVNNVFSLLSKAFQPAAELFNLKVFGGIPLYWFLLTPLMLAVLIGLVRFLKH